MIVLDLFCGLKGWSKAFQDRGHSIVSLDIDSSFCPTVVADILDITEYKLSPFGPFDVILASPSCECFSVTSISSHWIGGKDAYIPKDEKTRKAIRIVNRTIEMICRLQPSVWVMENPRGVLRKIIGNPICTVTYCQYGDTRMKPTDLWGSLPSAFAPLRCHNGDTCHEAAPRGARTGTQGLANYALRSEIPYGLSLAMCIACEQELQ